MSLRPTRDVSNPNGVNLHGYLFFVIGNLCMFVSNPNGVNLHVYRSREFQEYRQVSNPNGVNLHILGVL